MKDRVLSQDGKDRSELPMGTVIMKKGNGGGHQKCDLRKSQGTLFIYLFFVFFAISWVTPTAYGGSQARGVIRAVAASLRQSHSNTGSKPRLLPTPQLTATPGP